ncbi:MAG: hypothetical protein JNL54_03385 [Kineosporiaceae bacterium]|nr:hypothetical protein [Kineosporiaceae bacterium]
MHPGAATGVVGNLEVESGVNPRSVEPGGPGRGIAQWSVGGRWDQLVAWAKKGLIDRDPLDLDVQIGFMRKEMQDTGVWDALKTIDDPVQASAIFMRKYEKPADQSDAEAVRRANRGKQAVEGATDLNYKSPIDEMTEAVNKAIVEALVAAGEGAVKAVGPVMLKLLFVGLGIGLVGVGVVKGSGAR